MPEELLELETRRELYDLVRRVPGLHMREIQRQLDLSIALTEYHLHHMEEAGLIVSVTEGGYRRYYPATGADGGPLTSLGGQERRWVGLFRQPIPLQVTLFLLGRETATNSEMSEALDVSPSRLSFHLSKLLRNDVIERLPRREGRGYRVVDRPRVLRLLIAYRPPPDLLDEVAELWDSLDI